MKISAGTFNIGLRTPNDERFVFKINRATVYNGNLLNFFDFINVQCMEVSGWGACFCFVFRFFWLSFFLVNVLLLALAMAGSHVLAEHAWLCLW